MGMDANTKCPLFPKMLRNQFAHIDLAIDPDQRYYIQSF